MDPEKRFVYVIGPRGGPAKIGIADSCRTRRSILNVGNHLYLRIWHFFEADSEATARKIERDVHYQLSEKHIRGEWFRLTEADMPMLRRMIAFGEVLEFDSTGWSLERKGCDEFTPAVCAKARRALNLTVEDLASKAGISTQTLNNFELNRTAAQLETIEAIRDALEAEGVKFTLEAPGTELKVIV